MAIDSLVNAPRETIPTSPAVPAPQEGPRPSPTHKAERKTTSLLVALDLALLVLLWIAIGALRDWPFGNTAVAWPLLPVLAAGVLITGALGGAYSVRRLRRPRRRLEAAARQVLGGLIPAFLLGLLILPFSLSIWGGLIPSGFLFWLGYLLIRPLLSRTALRWTGTDRGPEERVLVVGAGRAAVRAARSLVQDGGDDVYILGFADSEFRRNVPLGYLSWRLESLQEVPELASQVGANQVLIVNQDGSGEDVVRLTDSLIRKGIRLRVVSNVFHRLVESVPLEQLDGLPVMEVGATPLRGGREVAKRVFDLAGALLGSLAILPVLLGIALAIRLTSRGPVLYRQTRLGRGGRPFTFYKFRSMVDTENESKHRAYVHELITNGRAAGNNGEAQPVYKFVDENRLTPIGRLLRRTSLDELPQLINVFRGEMSLVGPRPCVPFEYELYKDWQKGRLDVTPGMTGLWQVTGRSLVTFEDMVLMDLFYIANWSFLLDLKLLVRTVPVVIWGKGAL